MVHSEGQQTKSDGETITAIMPAFNGRSFILQTLPPLLEMQGRGDVQEVVVVDDGSTDDTEAVAVALGARVISSGGSRCGPSVARNKAAIEARGDILLFVDADVILNDDAVRHIRCALEDPNVVAVFGSYDDQPAATNALSQYKNLVHHHYHQIGRRDASTFWAGCGAVRRKAFLAVGGFCVERYPKPSIEDIDLGYRLRAAGGQIVLAPEMQGKHLKVWRLVNLLVTDLRYRALPWSRLLLAGEMPSGDLNVGVSERLRALLALALVGTSVASLNGIAPWWLPFSVAAAAFTANLDLFSLFIRHNRISFGVFGILFHQFYYLYSSAAYVYCWAEMRIQRYRRSSLSRIERARLLIARYRRQRPRPVASK